jgi:hypothetical protein
VGEALAQVRSGGIKAYVGAGEIGKLNAAVVETLGDPTVQS